MGEHSNIFSVNQILSAEVLFEDDFEEADSDDENSGDVSNYLEPHNRPNRLLAEEEEEDNIDFSITGKKVMVNNSDTDVNNSSTEDELDNEEDYDPERQGTSSRRSNVNNKHRVRTRGGVILRHAGGIRRRGTTSNRGRGRGRAPTAKKPAEDVWEVEIENQDNLNSSIPFLENTGLSRQAATTDSILGHFLLFFSDDILNQIIIESNRYSGGTLELTRNELLAFIGVCIAMGIIQLPAMSDYWSTSPITQVPWFSTIFTRKRFFMILANLHLVDSNVAIDEANKLRKLGNLMETCNQSFNQHYMPTQNLSIDEQMIGTRCRISFIQYMPKKPKKFGIKLWVLCEAMTGYVLKLEVYTGKSDEVVVNTLAHRVVFGLLENYLDRNHHLYIDNFYTSLKLVEDLVERNTFTCGTIRKDRANFPCEFKKLKLLKRGEMVHIKTKSNDRIRAVHWFDKRDVFALSSIHGSNAVPVLRRGEDKEVMKPEMIAEYNKYMNGVDKCDQYLASYSIDRKTVKWWKKIFFRILDVCVLNGMITYTTYNPAYKQRKCSHKCFRMELIHQLVQPQIYNVVPRVRSNNSEIDRLKGRHFPVSKHPQRGVCTNCGYQKVNGKQRRTKVSNFCEQCNKFICKKCFADYHTRSNPKPRK